MALPLEGLKVLDLSRLLPGPYATLVLADLGATVDKVEEPNGGDYIRQMPPMKGDESGLFIALNRNKRSVVLDLKKPEGIVGLKALVKSYDVLVESFRPGVMDRLGVGYEALSKENPRLVYCAISGFGQTGPDRLKAGHDIGYIARAGVLGYGGEANGPVAFPGVQMGDIGGGSLFGIVGILTALYERQRTGKGRFVDVSMTDGALAFVHMHLGARLAMGDEGQPLARGRESLNGAYPCYQPYHCQDGKYLAVGSLEPKFFQGLCNALERPELMTYDSGAEGAAARKELEKLFLTRSRDAWMTLLGPLDLCVEPVWEGDEVLSDPSLKARGLFFEIDGVKHLKTPLDFGEVPKRAPPALGADTRAVLQEAGVESTLLEKLAPR